MIDENKYYNIHTYMLWNDNHCLEHWPMLKNNNPWKQMDNKRL